MINRKSVLERHNPNYKSLNLNAPLSIGNGNFCFTADFTGLQTFFDEYSAAKDAFPLCTMAQWGWHSYPLSENEKSQLRLTPFDTYGRIVNYATDDTGQEELFKKIRVNAHKFHLGKVGFELSDKELFIKECKPVKQILSLWEGILISEFLIGSELIKTETFVHPGEDTLYIRISSQLLKEGKLRINMEFPCGSHKKNAADFSAADKHTTRFLKTAISSVSAERKLNDTIYYVTVNGSGFDTDTDEQKHKISIIPYTDMIELNIRFKADNNSGELIAVQPDSFSGAKTKCKSFWENYWKKTGFMDFSGSKSERANELERRIVLSHYLIAIQSRGKIPPAETGLTCNSWYGKFHLEMHFWHHAQFALWGKTDELKKSLEYYKEILPAAKKIASSQGYNGARWPKMCDPSGENTPSSVAVLLIWQQPHPIMFAFLLYRIEKNAEFLQEYREIVFETAEFMKSFIHWDKDRYVLGPPYIPAQERHDPRIVLNAGYELEYFRWGFKKADEILSLFGEEKRYAEIAEKLALPAVKDGLYLAHENCPDTFSKLPFYTDHPSMLAMYGVLDSEVIDPHIMNATLDKVLSVWKKETFYGWDFPMMAMTACRLGRYKDAIDILLMDSPKNTWLENGHNKMVGDDALPLYLPGNGGFLLAITMINHSFPEEFNVLIEGIYPYF